MQESINPNIDEFMAITGCDGHEAEYYLTEATHNLEKAIHSFFEDPTKAYKNIKKTLIQNQFKAFQTQQDKKKNITRNINIKGKQLIKSFEIPLKQNVVPTKITGDKQSSLDVGIQIDGLDFPHETLDEAILASYNSQKPILVIFSTKEVKDRLKQLVNKQDSSYISNNFVVFGTSSQNEEIKKQLKPQDLEQPSFNIFRINFTNEVHLMSQFDIKTKTTCAEISSFLHRSIQSIRQQQFLESEIKRHFEAKNNTNVNNNNDEIQMEEEESQNYMIDYQADKQIKRQQEQELQQMITQHQRKKSQQIEEALRQKQQQEKLQFLQQDRKVRKMSLPDEPSLGDIVTVSFRLPLGGRILRSFSREDKVQLIFSFIQLQQKVEFQNELDRKFDLLIMSPRCSLLDKKHLLIGEVFGEESQQIVLVKQL